MAPDSRMVRPGLQLCQGLLVRRPSSGEWSRHAVQAQACQDRGMASPASHNRAGGEDNENASGARQMHYNTRAESSEQTVAALPKQQEAVVQSRAAGNGLTWAELFMMKRKRLLERP
jgi:hypothetical protein